MLLFLNKKGHKVTKSRSTGCMSTAHRVKPISLRFDFHFKLTVITWDKNSHRLEKKSRRWNREQTSVGKNPKPSYRTNHPPNHDPNPPHCYSLPHHQQSSKQIFAIISILLHFPEKSRPLCSILGACFSQSRKSDNNYVKFIRFHSFER